MKLMIMLLGLLTSLVAWGADSAALTPHFKKVVWVVFENAEYSRVIKQNDFLDLSKKGALFTNFSAQTHPSQGNYIAMIAGSDFGIHNDGVINLDSNHLGDLLEKAGKDWRVYAEDYPGHCFIGSSSSNYVRKHVPFMSFTNVTRNPKRCDKIESNAQFDQDFSTGSLPEYSMYVPNLQSDGHNTSVDYAGKWLTKHFGAILSQPSNLGDVLFVITYDEGGLLSKNQIFTVLIGANVQAGVKNNAALNHISLLRLIEDEMGLGNLGALDAKAPPVTGIWK